MALAKESSAWLRAMRIREVYDVRVVYRALESLVLVRFLPNKIGLYSTRDGFHLELPPLQVPRSVRASVCGGGIPIDCECVTLDGKTYALGGKQLNYRYVYALDLAGLMQSKQCASMLLQKGVKAVGGEVFFPFFPAGTTLGIYGGGLQSSQR